MNGKMMDIIDRFNRHVAAVGFIADHADDNQTSQALATIENDMSKTAKMMVSLNEKKNKKG